MKKILVAIIALVIVSSCTQVKIAYVDLEDVMEDYKEMTELKDEMTAKQQEASAQLQQLQTVFQTKVQDYDKKSAQMSASKRQETQQMLQQEYQSIQMRQQQIAEQLQAENTEKSEALVKKMDSIVADYAKANTFNLILGTQGNTAVMYGDDALNITEQIVAVLNSEEPKKTE